MLSNNPAYAPPPLDSLLDSGHHSPFIVADNKAFRHSSCCEFHKVDYNEDSQTNFSLCCGCMDNGVGYLVKHCLCLPFTFGTMARIASEDEYSSLGCGAGLCAGVVVGVGVCGAPILPCAVKVRRSVVEKYGIKERFGESVVRVLCCPGASLVQVRNWGADERVWEEETKCELRPADWGERDATGERTNDRRTNDRRTNDRRTGERNVTGIKRPVNESLFPVFVRSWVSRPLCSPRLPHLFTPFLC